MEVIGIRCYSSHDLANWRNEGDACSMGSLLEMTLS